MHLYCFRFCSYFNELSTPILHFFYLCVWFLQFTFVFPWCLDEHQVFDEIPQISLSLYHLLHIFYEVRNASFDNIHMYFYVFDNLCSVPLYDYMCDLTICIQLWVLLHSMVRYSWNFNPLLHFFHVNLMVDSQRCFYFGKFRAHLVCV